VSKRAKGGLGIGPGNSLADKVGSILPISINILTRDT